MKNNELVIGASMSRKRCMRRLFMSEAVSTYADMI